MKSGEIEYNAYDTNIALEGTYNIAVKKSWSTDEWEFVATDKQGNFINIPKKLFPKRSATHMKFDDQNETVRDENSGDIYKVYSLPTL